MAARLPLLISAFWCAALGDDDGELRAQSRRAWAQSVKSFDQSSWDPHRNGGRCPDPNTRDQYSEFPYPPRDPSLEARSKGLQPLHTTSDSPGMISHILYAGRPLPTPFRMLFAGGGTGDGTVALAQLFTNAGLEFESVHIDMSAASIDIAQRRLDARGLGNTTKFLVRNISMLDPADAELGGLFDYINCVGVLHHLLSPLDGLLRLRSVLHETGGMDIMLYGEVGRTGTYHFQEAWRRLGFGRDVSMAKQVLKQLPSSNWLMKNNGLMGGHKLPIDAIAHGDNGLVDLLLHNCDTPFRVPDIVKLALDTHMRVVEFADADNYRLPDSFTSVVLRKHLMSLNWLEQASIVELLVGSLYQHQFFLGFDDSSSVNGAARTATGSAVSLETVMCNHPNYYGTQWVFPQAAIEQARAARSGTRLTFHDEYGNVHRHLHPLVAELFGFIDCRRSVARLHAAMVEAAEAPGGEGKNAFIKRVPVDAVLKAAQSFYEGQGTNTARTTYQLSAPGILIDRKLAQVTLRTYGFSAEPEPSSEL